MDQAKYCNLTGNIESFRSVLNRTGFLVMYIATNLNKYKTEGYCSVLNQTGFVKLLMLSGTENTKLARVKV